MNLKTRNFLLALAAAMIGAGITVLLAGQANWKKFAAWTIAYVSLQGWLFLPLSPAGN